MEWSKYIKKNIEWFISFTITGVLPLVLIFIFVGMEGDYQFLPHGVAFFGVALFIGFLCVLIAWADLRPSRKTYNDLRADLGFMVGNSYRAWLFGGGIGYVLSALYVALPSTDALAVRYRGSVGIYYSTVAGVLALIAFYSQSRPITNIKELLARMAKDLEDHQQVGHLWIVYPALAIGYYSHHRESDFEEKKHPYKQFLTNLMDVVSHLGSRAHLVTYPQAQYYKLFKSYHLQHQGNSRLKGSTRSETEIIKELATNFSNEDENTVKKCETAAKDILIGLNKATFHEVNPDDFPQHVIIIGDVIYILLSYGMPLYDPNLVPEEFFPVLGEPKVEIFATRRRDRSMAEMIERHLELWLKSIKEKEKEKKKEMEKTEKNDVEAKASPVDLD